MTKIQRVNSSANKDVEKTYKKTLLNSKNTGYIAATAVGLSSIRAFSKAKPITKTHKILGFISAGLTLLHIGCVEYLHHKYKKM